MSSSGDPDGVVTVAVDGPLDLARTLRPLGQGRYDPCLRASAGVWWRSTRTPDGPVTLALNPVPAVPGSTVPGSAVSVRAWGPGTAWALERARGLVGADDRPEDLTSMSAVVRHPVVADLVVRLPGLRIARTERVLEALLAAVFAQKVTGIQARRAWAGLLGRVGDAAPGPGRAMGLRVLPDPGRLAATPYWVFHRFGVERRRAQVVLEAAARADALERLVDVEPAEARARLQSLAGLGPWTANEITAVALGDPDAVSVGDYHLPNHVCWALAGQARATTTACSTSWPPSPPSGGGWCAWSRQVPRLRRASVPAWPSTTSAGSEGSQPLALVHPPRP